VWQLTRNELFKLEKRPLIWGLLALDLFFVFAAWLVLVYYAMKSPDGFQPGHLLGGADALSHAIGQPMTLGRRGGEFIAVALGGLAFGGEFSSGAIHLALSRGVNRTAYLIAKYLALALACCCLRHCSRVWLSDRRGYCCPDFACGGKIGPYSVGQSDRQCALYTQSELSMVSAAPYSTVCKGSRTLKVEPCPS
jgi:hypothetical protein